jgi:hypothetical protein
MQSVARRLLQIVILVASLPASAAWATNLLVNPSFESGNTGFSSAYAYKAPNSPGNMSEGEYSVIQSLNQVHAIWAGAGSLSAQSGTNYLVANGSSDTSLSPWQQTISITSGQITTSGSASPVYYRFEAYVASVYPAGAQPQLTFEMQYNDRPWQALTTSVAPASAFTWYLTYADGYFEMAPSTLSFRLRNAVDSALGNDLAIDSLSFGLTTQSPSYPSNPTINGGVQIVPEPSGVVLGIAGLMCGGLFVWRRRAVRSCGHEDLCLQRTCCHEEGLS